MLGGIVSLLISSTTKILMQIEIRLEIVVQRVKADDEDKKIMGFVKKRMCYSNNELHHSPP